ncbi:hypothetical protein HP439_04565 [Sphingobacterium shayense]|uniref:hypothetical protein n=1 Tax=Sphingobacterium shayense TaxID=626343 RepID=UPI001554DB46|nr:hypothetical protein [Sphingobacterium shayense]NQD69994.1 hypothetical protein [Sphingobacterium shayense]
MSNEENVFKDQGELVNQGNRSPKSRNNAVNLVHRGIFTENDLEHISRNISVVNLELNTLNLSKTINNSLDEFNFIISLSLHHSLIFELLKGIGTDVTWEAIKQVAIFIRNKISGKKIFKVTSRDKIEKEITFGIKMIVDKNTQFNFELKGDLDDKIINESLDKVLDHIKSQKVNSEYVHPVYLKYSAATNKWTPVDVLEVTRKKNRKKKK